MAFCAACAPVAACMSLRSFPRTCSLRLPPGHFIAWRRGPSCSSPVFLKQLSCTA